jgi:hypothetical protein
MAAGAVRPLPGGVGVGVAVRCAMCDGFEADPWIVVAVLDDEPVIGLICSTDCLIDYAAQVAAIEIEDA